MMLDALLFADATVQVRDLARSSRDRIEAARSAVQQQKAVVLPLRERVVQQTQLEYNAMQVGVFQLLEAKRQQLSAAEHYLTLRRDYWLARLDVERLKAGSHER
jgi:cobalt-zinc-cadmium efflux system outer membrane protein